MVGCLAKHASTRWEYSLRVYHLSVRWQYSTERGVRLYPAFRFCKVEFRDVLSPASSELKFKSLRTAFLCLSLSELGSEPKPPVMAAISCGVVLLGGARGGFVDQQGLRVLVFAA